MTARTSITILLFVLANATVRGVGLEKVAQPFFGKHSSRRNFTLETVCRFAGAMRPKTHRFIFGALLQAIVATAHLNGVFSDRAGKPVVPSHWRMLQDSCPFSMECFWRWPENDSSGSFYDVPMSESNDSKSRFQPQGGLPATLWHGVMPRGRRF